MRSPDEALAMATLWTTRGEARDLISWAKREIGERGAVEISKTEKLIVQLQACIDARNFVKATSIAARMHRQLFKLRALEAGPFAMKGRKSESDFRVGRTAANRDRSDNARSEWAYWNTCAAPHWERGISKNAVARIVQLKLGLKPKQIPNIARHLKKPRRAR